MSHSDLAEDGHSLPAANELHCHQRSCCEETNQVSNIHTRHHTTSMNILCCVVTYIFIAYFTVHRIECSICKKNVRVDECVICTTCSSNNTEQMCSMCALTGNAHRHKGHEFIALTKKLDDMKAAKVVIANVLYCIAC